MVKKLFKHEFLSYVRVMGILYIVLTLSACSCWVLRFLGGDILIDTIVGSLSTTTYRVSAAAAIIGAFAMAIIRFYRNLFTAEGYLSLTLPVTAGQHILAKAGTAAAVNLVTGLVVFLTEYIASDGETLTNVLAILNLMARDIPWIGSDGAFFLIEILLLLLVSTVSSIMLFYTFICVGQLFTKHRILAAVGAYFVYHILSQVFLTTLAFSSTFSASTSFGSWAFSNPAAAMHVSLWVAILWSALGVTIGFFVTRFIISKKLNLE